MADDEARPVRPVVRRPAVPEPKAAPTPTAAQAMEAATVRPATAQPQGRVEHATGEVTPAPFPVGFLAREGDVFVAAVPEVTLPLPRKFAMIKLGGMMYTRRMRDGEDVAEQGRQVYEWLEKFSERVGRDRFKRWVEQFRQEGASKPGSSDE